MANGKGGPKRIDTFSGDAFFDKRDGKRYYFQWSKSSDKVVFAPNRYGINSKELTYKFFEENVYGGPSWSDRDLENAYRENFEWNVDNKLGPNGREYLEDMIREAISNLRLTSDY